MYTLSLAAEPLIVPLPRLRWPWPVSRLGRVRLWPGACWLVLGGLRGRVLAVCTAAAMLLLLQLPAAAVAAPPGDIPTVIDNLRLWLVSILAAVATLLLTVGGLRYLVAGGDPAEVERAKGSLKAAAIGYAIAILAPLLLTILQGIVGGE